MSRLLNRTAVLRQFRAAAASWLQPGQRLRLPRGLLGHLEAKLDLIIQAEAAAYRPSKRKTGKTATTCQFWGCKAKATTRCEKDLMHLCQAHADALVQTPKVLPSDRIVEHQPDLIP